ncbi:cytochrome c [Fluviibacterium sp. DFM31]|uniref:Cytochrome c n=1 Tax=Meridianimarinicoccus marinus TaxID=3231483 RepID=A0ABV3L332_9RHOB
MNILKSLAFVLPMTLGTMALSQTEETNPIIKQRMEVMKSMNGSIGILIKMTKGEMAFDAEEAQAAAANIAETAAEVPALFEAEEMSEKSRALPAIWQNYEDFSNKADALRVAAETAATQIDAHDDLGPAVSNIGGACTACHKVNRAER